MRILLLFYTQGSGSYTRDLCPLVSGWEGARFPQVPERALPFWSRLGVEIFWGLGKIPRHRSFRNEIGSLFHLCCTKDDFSKESIGGFRNELFLKNLSLSFEKKRWASRTFRGLCKECSYPEIIRKAAKRQKFWEREESDLVKSRTSKTELVFFCSECFIGANAPLTTADPITGNVHVHRRAPGTPFVFPLPQIPWPRSGYIEIYVTKPRNLGIGAEV